MYMPLNDKNKMEFGTREKYDKKWSPAETKMCHCEEGIKPQDAKQDKDSAHA